MRKLIVIANWSILLLLSACQWSGLDAPPEPAEILAANGMPLASATDAASLGLTAATADTRNYLFIGSLTCEAIYDSIVLCSDTTRKGMHLLGEIQPKGMPPLAVHSNMCSEMIPMVNNAGELEGYHVKYSFDGILTDKVDPTNIIYTEGSGDIYFGMNGVGRYGEMIYFTGGTKRYAEASGKAYSRGQFCYYITPDGAPHFPVCWKGSAKGIISY
ncbi:MAG: hypothetical protein H6555_07290 [Lewinellaceae bacterium]|nr:hypothetical protein [Lewinellaceae bacterium]